MFSSSPVLVDTMLSLMPDAAVVVDDHGVIVSANAAVRDLFGYGPDELVGQRIEVLVPERFRAVHRGHRDAYIGSPRTRVMGAGLELFGRRRDGTEFPVDISLAPLQISERNATVAAIRDATERREAEAAHAQLAAIVESSSDAIFAMSVNGIVESWNPGAERILGYPAAEILGAHVSMLIPEQASPEFEEQLQAVLQGQPLGSRDTTWRTKDGRLLPVAVLLSPLQSGRGELTGFSVMLRDVTERKQAEERLRRLLSEGERNARWQAVMAEVRLQLLGDEQLSAVLELICERLCELLHAKGAIAAVGRVPSVVAAAGSARGVSADLGPLHLPCSGEDPRLIELAERDQALQGVLDDALVLLVPISKAGEAAGYLVCGLPEPPDEIALTIAGSLADQAGLGIEFDRARVDRELLLIGDERERIARELHDLVIQRLFASGLSLQSVLPLVHDERAVGRLSKVVDELDETIREIRTTIFTLAPSPLASTGLRKELLGVAADASSALGFEPALRFEGPVDAAVPAGERPHVLAVVREALANVARHAQANQVVVEVATDGVEITIVVSDDGVGVGVVPRESGLRNLRTRAEELGGRFDIGPGEGGGTRLEWRVPVGPTA